MLDPRILNNNNKKNIGASVNRQTVTECQPDYRHNANSEAIEINNKKSKVSKLSRNITI